MESCLRQSELDSHVNMNFKVVFGLFRLPSSETRNEEVGVMIRLILSESKVVGSENL